MNVFGGYADFYDLYYADKDYAAEVEFVLSLAARFGVTPRSVLDMGCGTGRHLQEFAARGLRGDGFDQSEPMLALGRERLRGSNIGLMQGDLTSFQNGHKYDLVVSMFAVMGYLVGNNHLLAGLRTAARHLRPRGLFIFDGWFGPAVLSQKPEERAHRYRRGDQVITRRVRPTLDAIRQTVRVAYDVTVCRPGAPDHAVHEEHLMRFLFVQELALALDVVGLELVHMCPFMDVDGALGVETWNACFAARRRTAASTLRGPSRRR